MAYIKNTWVDREGITRYFETIDEDGAIILTPDYAQVTEIGTPVNADNMNHIEEGIENHENRITVLENNAGDTNNLPVFCANSGNTTDGKADLLYLPSMGEVEIAWQSPIVSSATEYGNITWDRGNLLTLVDGSTSLVTIDGGTYNFTWEFPSDKRIFVNGFNVYWGWQNSVSAAPDLSKLYLYNNGELVAQYAFTVNNRMGWFEETFEKAQCDKIVFQFSGHDYSGVYSRIGEIKVIGTEIITVSTSTSCYFNVGGFYPELTATNANGESFNTSYIKTLTLDGTEADGTYNVFLNQESKTYILANTIYRQPETPTANENDVWLNTSVEPLTAKKYNGTTWVEFNDVPIGSMTIEGGIIQEVETFSYNNITVTHPNHTMPAVVVESYNNGASWYRIWSDGWCEQGGEYTKAAGAATALTVNLLKEYKDATYSILALAKSNGATTPESYDLQSNPTAKTTSTFSIGMGKSSTGWLGFNWETRGYIR